MNQDEHERSELEIQPTSQGMDDDDEVDQPANQGDKVLANEAENID